MNKGLLSIPSSDGFVGMRDYETETVVPAAFTAFVFKPHELGMKPLFLTSFLRCLSPENGFTPGDEIFTGAVPSAAVTHGHVPWATRMASGVAMYGIPRIPSTKIAPTTWTVATAANWRHGLYMVAPIALNTFGVPAANARLAPFATGPVRVSAANAFYRLGLPRGGRPKYLQVTLKCLADDLGYKPGDSVNAEPADRAATEGLWKGFDASGLWASHFGFPAITPYGGGNAASIVANKWMLFLQGIA
jgi:hypothetical protein